MISVRGWYKRRGGKVREVTHSTGYSLWTGNQKTVGLSLREKSDDDVVDKLSITFSYDAARHIIDAWKRYMKEYPESSQL